MGSSPGGTETMKAAEDAPAARRGCMHADDRWC